MKICIFTSVHHHDDVRIYHKEAKALREKGYEVVLLCPDYEGKDENGITFVRVPLPKSRLLRMASAPRKFFSEAKKQNADVYHFHDPELIGTGKRLQKYGKVIYDVHEDVPRQILTKPYLKEKTAAFFSNWFEKRENKAFQTLDVIITAAPVIENRVKKLTENTMLVCNFPKLEEFAEIDVPFSKREQKACYVGGITKIRGAIEMTEAMEGSPYRLELAGSYESDELKSEVEAHPGFAQVDYLGFLDRTGIRNLLSSVSVGLVTLHPTPTYIESLPVKMFEYMVSGIPVIASDFPYWQEIVDDAKCGVCVNPMKPEEIRNAISYILKNPDAAEEMGQNGRRCVLEKYNWDIEKRKLLAVYGYLEQVSDKDNKK